MTDIVAKLRGLCHTLRHDGIDYGDYIEQLTIENHAEDHECKPVGIYFLLLKMIDE